jgi:hypothetical protein
MTGFLLSTSQDLALVSHKPRAEDTTEIPLREETASDKVEGLHGKGRYSSHNNPPCLSILIHPDNRTYAIEWMIRARQIRSKRTSDEYSNTILNPYALVGPCGRDDAIRIVKGLRDVWVCQVC